MSPRYAPRKYPFAYLANGDIVRHDRARREIGPFYEDAEGMRRLVLRRRGRCQYFARPPRRRPGRPNSADQRVGHRGSVHSTCIDVLQQQLESDLSVRVRPYDGLRVHPIVDLLPGTAPGIRYCVRERALPEHPSIRPDLQLRTRDGLLLVIEVCSTHPVGARKAEVYRLLGVHCVELRAIYGVDADGTLNAERMWGPAAPALATQRSLTDLAPRGSSGGPVLRKSQAGRRPLATGAGVRCRPPLQCATNKATASRLHRIISDYVRALQVSLR